MPSHLVTRLAVTVVLALSAATRADDPTPRTAAVAFLKAHVVGKSVVCTLTNRIPAEKVETVFERRTTFGNLTESRYGVGFDQTSVIRQVVYDLDDAGKRVGVGRVVDRSLVVRTRVQERQSARLLVGTAEIVASDPDRNVGNTDAVTVEVVGETPVVVSTTIGVDDHFAGKGQVKPGFSEVRSVYRVADGKLHRDTTEGCATRFAIRRPASPGWVGGGGVRPSLGPRGGPRRRPAGPSR